MTKITHAKHVDAMIIELRFSDGSFGEYDFAPMVKRDTVLTKPLADPDYFRSFFIELGALGWANGLELSAGALHAEMLQSGKLKRSPATAHAS
jgi:hypothetical protein